MDTPLKECTNNHLFNGDKYGEICPYCGMPAKDKSQDAKTPEELAREFNVPYERRVRAWLVCVEGVSAGVSYEVRAGKNFIGSGADMDIRIQGDKKIDRSRHAILVYDDMSGMAKLLPGEGKGMVYLGREAVYAPVTVEADMRITLGGATLMYVPFCGERFIWPDEKDGE
jgi:hypothetical protein